MPGSIRGNSGADLLIPKLKLKRGPKMPFFKPQAAVPTATLPKLPTFIKSYNDFKSLHFKQPQVPKLKPPKM